MMNPFEIADRLATEMIYPQKIHRILLWGPPGTGKSYWPFTHFNRDHVHRQTLHQQMPPEDLLGCKELVANEAGGTSTVWADGPAVIAMDKGHILVLDEIDAFSPEIRCILHAILDDRETAVLELPGGRCVRPAKGYGVVATTNRNPSTLPDPILDRFEVVLRIDGPAPGIVEAMPNGYQQVLQRHYRALRLESFKPGQSARRLRALKKLEENWSLADAAKAVFPGAETDITNAIQVQRGASKS